MSAHAAAIARHQRDGTVPLVRISIRACVLTVGLVTSSATTAWAQSTPVGVSADDTRARALFFEGAEALEHGDSEHAIEAFRASFALRPRAIVVLNIAQAYRAAGLPREAIAAYEQYLALSGNDVSRERASSVRDTIAFLRRSTALLTLETLPLGATARIDGRALGITPLAEPVALLEGPHRIELDLEGFVPLRERFTIAPGARLPMRFRLASASAAATLTVAVNQSLPGARVTLDGVSLGAPPVTRQVEPGGHRVEVSAPGRERFASEIVLSAHQQRALSIRLAEDTPVYRRPWLWIGAAVIVAGAAATGAILATQTGAQPSNVIEVGPAR